MSERIRAALCREFGQPLTIEEVVLADPGPGEVKVRIKAVAMCHSDISYVEGAWGGPLPAVFGHEAAGVVEDVGEGVGDIAPGQHVVVTFMRHCETCPRCTSGRPAICDAPGATAPLALPDGTMVNHGLDTGAFAQKAVVHRSQVVPVEPDVPFETAALLGCSVLTGVGAVVNSAGMRPGETVVVIGAGGVGLNAIQGAAIAGAGAVVAVDVTPEKLEDARAFGATHGVLATEDKPYRAVKAVLGGRGADHVIVTTGAIEAFHTAPRYGAKGAKIVVVGMPPSGEKAQYEPVVLAASGQSIVGSRMGDVVPRRDVPWLLTLWRQGRLDLDSLVSGRFSLDEINDAIAATDAGKARRGLIVMA